MHTQKEGILLVANWDSATGYAWWLMESYWSCLGKAYAPVCASFLAYPSISEIPAVILSAPIECVCLDFTRKNWATLLRQLRFLLKYKVRTIYFSDQPFFHWHYILFRFFGVKTIVVHDHTPGIRLERSRIRRAIKRMIYYIPGLSANAVFGATEFVTDRAVSVASVPPDRCFTVRNGLPDMDYGRSVCVRELFNIPIERKVLVSVGRATEYKGIHFVLESLDYLIREKNRLDVHFLYCGGGPDLEKFKQYAYEKKIDQFVTFAGLRNDVNDLLCGCDFSIQPSNGEVGYSLSILEYMRAGLAVIVPDNPSVCGATKHEVTGLIYKQNDMRSMADAIARLLDQPELARDMGEKAMATQKKEYSLSVAHGALLDSMRQVDPLMNKANAERKP